jgi:GT2 family glycosyltransferase
VFRRVGGFDEAFPYAAMEDVDLRERLKAADYQISFVPAAIVDHPPRKIRDLSELKHNYISIAYYTVRKRGERLKMRTLLMAVLRTRLRRILKAPDRTDSVRALRLLICELLMIVACTKSWERMFQIQEHA